MGDEVAGQRQGENRAQAEVGKGKRRYKWNVFGWGTVLVHYTDGNCCPDSDVFPSHSSLSNLALTCMGQALCLMLRWQIVFTSIFILCLLIHGFTHISLACYLNCICCFIFTASIHAYILSILPATELRLKMDIKPSDSKPCCNDGKMWLSDTREWESQDHRKDDEGHSQLISKLPLLGQQTLRSLRWICQGRLPLELVPKECQQVLVDAPAWGVKWMSKKYVSALWT